MGGDGQICLSEPREAANIGMSGVRLMHEFASGASFGREASLPRFPLDPGMIQSGSMQDTIIPFEDLSDCGSNSVDSNERQMVDRTDSGEFIPVADGQPVFWSHQFDGEAQATRLETSSTSASTTPSAIPIRSCQACAKSKVKCDRAMPACSRCKAKGKDCVYPDAKVVAKRAHRVPRPRLKELRGQLKQLQGILHQSTTSHATIHQRQGSSTSSRSSMDVDDEWENQKQTPFADDADFEVSFGGEEDPIVHPMKMPTTLVSHAVPKSGIQTFLQNLSRDLPPGSDVMAVFGEVTQIKDLTPTSSGGEYIINAEPAACAALSAISAMGTGMQGLRSVTKMHYETANRLVQPLFDRPSKQTVSALMILGPIALSFGHLETAHALISTAASHTHQVYCDPEPMSNADFLNDEENDDMLVPCCSNTKVSIQSFSSGMIQADFIMSFQWVLSLLGYPTSLPPKGGLPNNYTNKLINHPLGQKYLTQFASKDPKAMTMVHMNPIMNAIKTGSIVAKFLEGKTWLSEQEAKDQLDQLRSAVPPQAILARMSENSQNIVCACLKAMESKVCWLQGDKQGARRCAVQCLDACQQCSKSGAKLLGTTALLYHATPPLSANERSLLCDCIGKCSPSSDGIEVIFERLSMNTPKESGATRL